MTKNEQRYNVEHYDRRINQNRAIISFLVDKIMTHAREASPWTRDELAWLKYEDLFEIAIAATNKRIKITCAHGEDWSAGADGKVSVVRHHSSGKSYTAGIPGCGNKKYVLALVYERIQDRFYYFAFPSWMREYSIPFHLDGEPKRANYMWDYEVKSWSQLADRADTWKDLC